MLEGSPDDYIHQPILKYLAERGVTHQTSRRITEIRCARSSLVFFGHATTVEGGLRY